ncbi:hypothetical protein GOP47_0018707 [Adiantum capillus-veneris]|uniref:DUF7804 domain-containing protein n=1 Tax=Adiantum capillus-veneris TaxID=13818 RepID=A0A9D4Z8E5_ADICA|nr:hypothetical protein GOP47_0018707 [Adiantum capillus-veneris]
MVRGSLMQGFTNTFGPFRSYSRIAIPKSPCSLSARVAFPKVSCKNFPSVASNTIDRLDLTCARSHETLLKHSALALNQTPVDSCNRSSFSARWIEDCICEIVRHIHEAPFMQMLVNHEDTSTVTLTQRQRVPIGDALSADEKWREMKSHLGEASPDAVILVDDLCNSYIEGCNVEEGLEKQNRGVNLGHKEARIDGTHLWGVFLLGKTITESACYILETTSVASSFGMCTRFCLTKAHCFGPSFSDQIQNSWLLKTED